MGEFCWLEKAVRLWLTMEEFASPSRFLKISGPFFRKCLRICPVCHQMGFLTGHVGQIGGRLWIGRDSLNSCDPRFASGGRSCNVHADDRLDHRTERANGCDLSGYPGTVYHIAVCSHADSAGW